MPASKWPLSLSPLARGLWAERDGAVFGCAQVPRYDAQWATGRLPTLVWSTAWPQQGKTPWGPQESAPNVLPEGICSRGGRGYSPPWLCDQQVVTKRVQGEMPRDASNWGPWWGSLAAALHGRS